MSMDRTYDTPPDGISRQRTTEVDKYITSKLPHDDAILEKAIKEQQAGGLPDIAVSPTQGKFLYLLLKTMKAKTVLEFGTLGGYSTIWLARALSQPQAHIYTFEIDEKHAQVARKNIEHAGLKETVSVIVGPAKDSMQKLKAEGTIKDVDFAFIDADKESGPIYFSQSLSVAKPGSIIIVDNVIRNGNVVDASHTSKAVQGVRATFDLMAELEKDGYIETTALQTVGEKNYDGFAISYVLKPKADHRSRSMGNSFSQLQDLFVNKDCIEIEELFARNKGGLALGLCCFAVATFVLEALITLAVLSCAVRELRMEGVRGYFWRLGPCLCVPRKMTRAEMQDLERSQPMSSDPTSTRKSRREDLTPFSDIDMPSQIAAGAPGMPPAPQSGFDSLQSRQQSPSTEVLTLRKALSRRPSQTMASGRRFAPETDSLWRKSPGTLRTMQSRDSSRGRSQAQQYAAEIMGENEDDATIIHQTFSPVEGEFPFPRVGSNSGMSRRERPAPQSSYSGSPGSMWTRRK